MKRVAIITALLLAIALPSSLVMAQNNGTNNTSTPQMNMMQGQAMTGMMQGNRMNGMQGRMMGMMSMMRNRMQKMMNNPQMRMRMSVYALPSFNILGLKAEQKTKLNNLKSDYIKSNQKASAKIQDLQKQLKTELAANSLNIRKVRKLIKQKADAQSELQLSVIETYHNMFGILTAKQQKQLKSMNAQSFMRTMMNTVPMGQMMTLCPMNGSGKQRMMRGPGMMNGMKPNSMMN